MLLMRPKQKEIETSHNLTDEFLSWPHNKTSAKFSKEVKSPGGMINSDTGRRSLSYITTLDLVLPPHLAA